MKQFQIVAGLVLMMAMAVMGGVPSKPSEFNCVFDYGGMLQPEEAQLIRVAGNYIRAKSGAELVVVTVESLDGMVLEDYAHELFNTWGIGDKEKNNGVLLLVNKETTLAGTSGRVRIEVGYGLEGALPDSVCGRILDEKTLPAWDKKEYGRGIVDGYMELVRRTAIEYVLDVPQELMEACGMEPIWCDVVERPDQDSTIYDIANVLNEEQRKGMEAICAELKELAKVKMIFVSVQSAGDDMKIYMRSLMRSWKLTEETEDPMVVMLFDLGKPWTKDPGNSFFYACNDAMKKHVLPYSFASALDTYIGSPWRKKDYGKSSYRAFLRATELITMNYNLTLSKENKSRVGELHPWYEMVLGVILGFFLCLGVPFLIIRHIIDLFRGLGGGGGGSGSYSGGYSSSRSSSYSSSRSSGGGFGGGHSGGGGASR